MARATGAGGVRVLEHGASVECARSFLLYNFDIEGHLLKPPHQDFLRQRAHKVLSNDSRTRMRVVGRASRSGRDDYNQRLSQRRAESVVSFVMALGFVDPSQIDTAAVGESQPLSAAQEADDDRSVEVHFEIPDEFVIALENVTIVHHWRQVETQFENVFRPLALRAGRRLMLGRRTPADIVMSFDLGGRESRPCARLILGNEGGGIIFVGAHKDLRVCGIPELDRRTGHVNHAAQIQRVFEEDEPQFARFVANTAIHEAGHIMGLPHVPQIDNFMFSVGQTAANLPRERRTLETMRRHWAGTKWFDPGQTTRMLCAIRSGFYPGGMILQSPQP